MSFPLVDILLLALAAGFIVLRLRSMLGRRTGNEPPPGYRHRDAMGQIDRSGKVVRLPGAENAADDPAGADAAEEAGGVAAALTQIQLADRNFDPDGFLAGAKAAYEMIITGFARGDRAGLEPLLAEDVFDSFDAVIKGREDKGHEAETQLVGIERAEIVGARLRERIAEITVKFISEIISVTRNADGAVIEGDPTRSRRITDIWTFARDTRSRDPNWKLVGTATG